MTSLNHKQQEFQRLFQEKFNEMINEGKPKNEAASEALSYANRSLAGEQPNHSNHTSLSTAEESMDIILPKEVEEEVKKVMGSDELFMSLDRYRETGSDKDILLKSISSFYSASINLSHSFAYAGKISNMMDVETDPHPSPSPIPGFLTIDVEEVKALYEKIFSFQDAELSSCLHVALEKLILEISFQILDSSSKALGYAICHLLKPFIIALLYPELNDPSNMTMLSLLLTESDRLSVEGKAQLVHWFSHAIDDQTYLSIVSLIRQFITVKVYEESFEEARSGVRMMAVLYLGLAHHPSISYKEFYNDALNNDYLESREGKIREFQLWIKDQYHKKSAKRSSSSRSSAAVASTISSSSSSNSMMVADSELPELIPVEDSHPSSEKMMEEDSSASAAVVVIDPAVVLEPLVREIKRYTRASSFISYPFVLSPATKAAVLEIDTAFQMQREMEHEVHAAMLSGQRYVMPYLVLRVSRESIVADTIIQMSLYSSTSDFKKPLKIIFDNEEGVDAGGVRKEFFQVINRQLLDPSYGMFKYYADSRLLWFNSDSYETSQEFELIGTLLGVAIYNSIIIDLRMPRVVYKKLKGQKSNLTDLMELEPALGRGLQSLLDYDESADISSIFEAVFQITYEVFGEIRVVDLVPNGGNIRVGVSNRQQYVDLYVKYIMEDSISSQFAAFAKGFKKVSRFLVVSAPYAIQ
jgi:hypothetical protein